MLIRECTESDLDALRRMHALHDAGERDLHARGLDDTHAWLPPSIARRFGHRLEALGWVRDNSWTPYCRILRVPNAGSNSP